MNSTNSQNLTYQLLDFGSGRKLEQFGARLLDRPCPAADLFQPRNSSLWKSADIRLPQDKTPADHWLTTFKIAEGLSLTMQLSITPFGHVGLFPEQLPHWIWLYEQVKQAPLDQVRALNLFAYTGGSTLAMAMGGAQVVHVDASAPSVSWARTNAAQNQFQDHPIRWIVEDARKFVEREIRRGNHYDIIVLDPPSYGHGPSGKAWDLAHDWQRLLDGCLRLIETSSYARLLWTGHSEVPSVDQIDVILRSRHMRIQRGRNLLTDVHNRALDAGHFIRGLR
ncbi:MAG: class I SAM-dependent methyltransferase [Pirellulales bacterium]